MHGMQSIVGMQLVAGMHDSVVDMHGMLSVVDMQTKVLAMHAISSWHAIINSGLSCNQ